MNGVDRLVLGLADGLPDDRDGDGVTITVAAVEVAVPVEARIDGDGLRASLPRGVMATGFSIPHGRMVARFVREEETP